MKELILKEMLVKHLRENNCTHILLSLDSNNKAVIINCKGNPIDEIQRLSLIIKNQNNGQQI